MLVLKIKCIYFYFICNKNFVKLHVIILLGSWGTYPSTTEAVNDLKSKWRQWLSSKTNYLVILVCRPFSDTLNILPLAAILMSAMRRMTGLCVCGPRPASRRPWLQTVLVYPLLQLVSPGDVLMWSQRLINLSFHGNIWQISLALGNEKVIFLSLFR